MTKSQQIQFAFIGGQLDGQFLDGDAVNSAGTVTSLSPNMMIRMPSLDECERISHGQMKKNQITNTDSYRRVQKPDGSGFEFHFNDGLMPVTSAKSAKRK